MSASSAWSPDGRRLCVVSSATDRSSPRRRAPRPGDRAGTRLPPHRPAAVPAQRCRLHLPASRPTCGSWMSRTAAPGGSRPVRHATASLPGAPTAAVSPSCRTGILSPDLTWRADVYLIDAEGGPVTPGHGRPWRPRFGQPTWSPDGSLIAAIGSPVPGRQCLGQQPVAVRARGRAGRSRPDRG